MKPQSDDVQGNRKASASTTGGHSPVVIGNQNTTATGKSTAGSKFHSPSFLGGVVSGVVASLVVHIIIRIWA